MHDIENILTAMESCISRLKTCLFEHRISDMPYLLGALTAYNELLQETINSELSKTTEPRKE